MTVAHVFAQADIGHDEQSGQFAFQLAHRTLHNAVFGVGTAGTLVLLWRDTKQDHRRDTGLVRCRRLTHNLIDRQLKHPRH